MFRSTDPGHKVSEAATTPSCVLDGGLVLRAAMSFEASIHNYAISPSPRSAHQSRRSRVRCRGDGHAWDLRQCTSCIDVGPSHDLTADPLPYQPCHGAERCRGTHPGWPYKPVELA